MWPNIVLPGTQISFKRYLINYITGVACNYVLYAKLSGGRFCICNRVRPDAAAKCSCVCPVQNRPCSKLNALGRQKTFAICFECVSISMSCTCPPDDFCIAPDTIAYAKVSGADIIALRTQLHLTPASLQNNRLSGNLSQRKDSRV